MPRTRSRRLSPYAATPGQMFRAVAVGLAFAMMLVWTLRQTPAGATEALASQIVANR
jgi:hypothetical protein